MGQFLWQELDEVGDFGRFAVKKRLGFFSLLGLLDERGFLTRRRGDSGREERLQGLSTATVTVVSAPERDFARILHFQRCGRISRNLAPGSSPR
jgi:hypothetical protein